MANTILVAEDDTEWQEIICTDIERNCNDVELKVAATREEALAVIAKTSGIKVVVTDLRMPGVGDGEYVAAAAQQKGIKVIVLSGTLDDLSKTVRGNCVALFSKAEYDAKTLAEAINGVISS